VAKNFKFKCIENSISQILLITWIEGERVKQFLVICLIAGGLLSMIIYLDFVSGTSPQYFIRKALNPFRVMEAAEYLIVLLFVLFFMIKTVGSYIKKKRQSQTPTK
jgi:hypothetical protein